MSNVYLARRKLNRATEMLKSSFEKRRVMVFVSKCFTMLSEK